MIDRVVYRLYGLTEEEVAVVEGEEMNVEIARQKLWDVRQQRQDYEGRYGMDFAAFKQAWHDDRIPNAHSFEVERDYWEWEATVTDEERLLDDFAIVIEKEPGDEGYFAYSPNQPRCFSNGLTIEETRCNMRDAMEQHLSALQNHCHLAPCP